MRLSLTAQLLFSLYGAELSSSRAIDQRAAQQILFSDKPGRVVSLELISHESWYYSTTLSIGNPPVLFKALVDINWSDTWVPSAKCTEPEYCYKHPQYDSAVSSTYVPDGRSIRMVSGGYYTWGYASMDSIWLGDIEVKDQVFEEATILRPNYFFDETAYESTLGLSRVTIQGHEDSNLSVPSAFQNAIRQKALDRNVFGLRFPQSTNETGTLTIGGVEEAFKAPAAESYVLPLSKKPPNSTSPIPDGGWMVEAVSVTLATKESPLTYDLTNYTTVLSTSHPFFIFPKGFPDEMDRRIGSDLGGIPCADVTDDLPDLIISLKGERGVVHDFVIKPHEYAPEELRLPFSKPEECFLMVGDTDAGDGGFPLEWLNLGTLFLRKFYSVFDDDKRTVTCKSCLIRAQRYTDCEQ